MVVTAQSHQSREQHQSHQRESCPRCGSALLQGRYEPECLTCGYADYGSAPARNGQRSSWWRGDAIHVRYRGSDRALAGRVLVIRMKLRNHRVFWEPDCPYCAKPMKLASLSGNRRAWEHERFTCPQDHRISVDSHGSQPSYWSAGEETGRPPR